MSTAYAQAPPRDTTAQLYERHSSRIFGFCLSRLGSREDAEDALQLTFLNAQRGLGRGVVPDHELAWLFKIAQNVCHNRHQSAKRRGRVEAPHDLDSLQDVIASPERGGSGVSLGELTQALGTIPARQRKALLLREFQAIRTRRSRPSWTSASPPSRRSSFAHAAPWRNSSSRPAQHRVVAEAQSRWSSRSSSGSSRAGPRRSSSPRSRPRSPRRLRSRSCPPYATAGRPPHPCRSSRCWGLVAPQRGQERSRGVTEIPRRPMSRPQIASDVTATPTVPAVAAVSPQASQAPVLSGALPPRRREGADRDDPRSDVGRAGAAVDHRARGNGPFGEPARCAGSGSQASCSAVA